MLAASAIAAAPWQGLGAPATFAAGAVFAAVMLAALVVVSLPRRR